MSSASNSHDTPAEQAGRKTFSRRTVLGATGAGIAAGGAVGAAGALGVRHAFSSDGGSAADQTVPFRGDHQAGITTPAQDRLHFAAFDVITNDKAELVALLQKWTAAAERMTRGLETEDGGATGRGEYFPPSDTGEALDLAPGSLTLTIGFGPSLFGAGGQGSSNGGEARRRDRFGLAHLRPAALEDLPTFAGDEIDVARSHGDIAIQACADDPQVAVHAIRNLARMGFGVVAVRYSQLGFGRTSSTSSSQRTPRNMFGFKDGTANIKSDDAGALSAHVWAQPGDGPSWMDGGTYMIARRIRMDIEAWDRANLTEQERVIGRDKREGAPLGQAFEHDAPDFTMTTGRQPVIPADAHVRLAHPDFNSGTQILRRGYNFTDGSDGFGHLDAGLFFICFQRDPVAQFVPLQRQLSREDALNEYIAHTSTGIYACPPGLAEGQWWGQELFEG